MAVGRCAPYPYPSPSSAAVHVSFPRCKLCVLDSITHPAYIRLCTHPTSQSQLPALSITAWYRRCRVCLTGRCREWTVSQRDRGRRIGRLGLGMQATTNESVARHSCSSYIITTPHYHHIKLPGQSTFTRDADRKPLAGLSGQQSQQPTPTCV